MKRQRFGPTDEQVSSIIQGCMQIASDWDGDPNDEAAKRTFKTLDTALECGIDFFDHADVYGRNKCEQLFGHWLSANKGLREKIFIQTKCGIRIDIRGYDFSAEYIQRSVEGSLKRLQIEQIDCLMLHRPDALAEPEQVAQAFDQLHAAGKVRHFGVSNQNAGLLELMRANIKFPIVANQVEMSLMHAGLLDAATDWNAGPDWGYAPGAPTIPDVTFPYCHQHQITIQAYSPVARGLLTGKACPADDARADRVATVMPVIQELAKEMDVPVEAIVIGWLLSHPAQIQPILGTVNPDRIRASCRAADISLSRGQWYRLYVAARGRRVP